MAGGGADGSWNFVWLDGKKYSRRTGADGSREYGVHVGSSGVGSKSHWQKLPSRCLRMMSNIDAAIAAQN